MIKGMKIEEFMDELKRRDGAKRDFIAPTPKLAMTERSELMINDSAFPVNEFAHGQIAGRLQIPKGYYDRMREEYPGLLAYNVNGWLHKNPETRMVRTLDGRVRAFLSDRYRTIDNLDVINTVTPVMFEAGITEIKSTQITDQRLYVQAVSTHIEGEIKVGDMVQAGLILSNSEVGAGSVKLEGVLYRLLCLNMMVRPEKVRKYHVGRKAELEPDHLYTDSTRLAIDKTFLMKLRDVARAMLDRERFGSYIEKLRSAAEEQIDKERAKSVSEIVEVSAKKWGLNEGEGMKLLEGLIEEGTRGNYSKYGLANAVTQIANDHKDYDRAVELERLGGEIIEMGRKEFESVWKAQA